MVILETTYTIAPFNPEIDDPAEIADMHRLVREWEVENCKNTFTDILDSQVDLRAIPEYYIDSGGNFFVARSKDQQKVGFVGLRNEDAGIGQLKRLAVLRLRRCRMSHHHLGDPNDLEDSEDR